MVLHRVLMLFPKVLKTVEMDTLGGGGGRGGRRGRQTKHNNNQNSNQGNSPGNNQGQGQPGYPGGHPNTNPQHHNTNAYASLKSSKLLRRAPLPLAVKWVNNTF